MRPNQLLQAIGPELRAQIMSYLQTEQRPAYKAVIDSLAPARRLRPAFILEKIPRQAGRVAPGAAQHQVQRGGHRADFSNLAAQRPG